MCAIKKPHAFVILRTHDPARHAQTDLSHLARASATDESDRTG
jgi:hypothetical protein